MPDKNPKPRRPPSTSSRRRSRPPNPNGLPHRRTGPVRPRKSVRILRRYSSEPILWTVQFISTGEGDPTERALGSCWNSEIGHSLFLPRPDICTDVFSAFSRRSFEDEVKVVVSVTVEGSPGPVRTMVRLGASVAEAIAAVVDMYGREGRSPRLDRAADAGLQLHHSYFSLQGLNKSDKIGEVGGRSFYLRKSNYGSSDINIAGEGSEAITSEHNEIELVNRRPPVLRHLFFTFFGKRLDTIGRRTRKLWKLVVCFACS